MELHGRAEQLRLLTLHDVAYFTPKKVINITASLSIVYTKRFLAYQSPFYMFKIFSEKVSEHYKAGTYRYGFLDNISLVGTVSEESGGYIPDVLDMLEECRFLRLVRFIFFDCCTATYHF